MENWMIKMEMKRSWRNSILKRDNYQCVMCKSTENLTGHHVKGQTANPDEKYDVNNGITLCRKCHDDIEKLRQLKKMHVESKVVIYK